MHLTELAEIVVSVLVSLGGGGAIVLGLSNWLGKIWAERLMEKEKARYQKELENFKAQLNRENDRTGQTLREKLALYKDTITPIVNFIMALSNATPDGNMAILLIKFEKERLATTALLGMFAPLPVFEAYNEIIDYLFDCLEGKRIYEFAEFRRLSFRMLSEIRRDIGVSGDELVYRGPR
jgi:hypothetical protein